MPAPNAPVQSVQNDQPPWGGSGKGGGGFQHPPVQTFPDTPMPRPPRCREPRRTVVGCTSTAAVAAPLELPLVALQVPHPVAFCSARYPTGYDTGRADRGPEGAHPVDWRQCSAPSGAKESRAHVRVCRRQTGAPSAPPPSAPVPLPLGHGPPARSPALWALLTPVPSDSPDL